MRYMLLICSDRTAPAPAQAEMTTIVQGHVRFAEELRAAGKMVHADRLRSSPAGSPCAKRRAEGWALRIESRP
jgi:hypothetical protein